MKSKTLLSLFLLSVVFTSGCAPAKPIVRPRIFHDSDCGKAFLEDRGKQQRHCEPTCVLGFELGNSTYVEVKARLPRGANPRDRYYGTDGPFFITNGAVYGIAGLQSVAFSFNSCWKLASVNMNFSEWGFAAYKKHIALQYPLYVDLSGGTTIYKANPGDDLLGNYFGDYIVVDEKYSNHYGKTFCRVSFTTTLPFDLKEKIRAQRPRAKTK